MSSIEVSSPFSYWFFFGTFVLAVVCAYLIAWAAGGRSPRFGIYLMSGVIGLGTFGCILVMFWSEFSRVDIRSDGTWVLYNPAGAPVGRIPPGGELQVQGVDPSEEAGLSNTASHQVITHRVLISTRDLDFQSVDLPTRVRDRAVAALAQQATSRPPIGVRPAAPAWPWARWLLYAAFALLLIAWSYVERQRQRIIGQGHDYRKSRRWVSGILRTAIEVEPSAREARFSPAVAELEVKPSPPGGTDPYRTPADGVITVDLSNALFPVPIEPGHSEANDGRLRLAEGTAIDICGTIDGSRLTANGDPLVVVDLSRAPRARWMKRLAEPLRRRRRIVGTLIRYAIPTAFLARLYL